MNNTVLEVGLTNTVETVVTNENCAQSVGSGDTMVFATPAMIALMEKTSAASVSSCLDDGSTTVGTLVSIEHLAATPVGMKVKCTSTLTEIDGRKLVFNLEVFDECTKIGSGVHHRFIVNRSKFQQKADSKLSK